MIRQGLIFAFVVASVVACSGPKAQYLVEPVASDLKLRTSLSTLMVKTVSLPSYAAAEDVAIQDESGAVVTQKGALWADQPERATTLTLARNLTEILSAQVAPEPWPLDGLPDAAVDVRVERMLAGNNGSFQLTGIYYIGGEAQTIKAIAHSFRIETPVAKPGLTGIAAAQAIAIRQLSEQIARDIAQR
jgi:uncharacterized lipoprotein YmbA